MSEKGERRKAESAIRWTGSQETCNKNILSKPLSVKITARARFQGHCARNHCSSSLSRPLCSKSLLGLAYLSFGVTVLRVGLRNHCSTSLSKPPSVKITARARSRGHRARKHCSSLVSWPLCSKSLLGLSYLSFGVTVLLRTRTVFSN